MNTQNSSESFGAFHPFRWPQRPTAPSAPKTSTVDPHRATDDPSVRVPSLIASSYLSISFSALPVACGGPTAASKSSAAAR